LSGLNGPLASMQEGKSPFFNYSIP
jgi:hypothetical protein